MSSDGDESRSRSSRSFDVLRVPRWGLWTCPPAVLAAVLAIELAAVLLVLVSQPPQLPGASHLIAAGVLLGLGVVHSEISLHVERIRRRVSDAVHVDLVSVWTFAAAVLLPPGLVAALVVVLQLYLWRRAWFPRAPLYRQVFSSATIVLACLAARAVLDGAAPPGESGILAVVLAIVAYYVVNSGLVAGIIAISSPTPSLAAALGDRDENLLEIATICLGALTAVALRAQPVLVAFVLPALLLLHRAVLARHLQVAASTDQKTGLLNAAAWHHRAQYELERRGPGARRCAVLVVDIDHFKSVNDTHGHLVGDQVLAAVADVLRAEARQGDLVGRFGGEEFVLLLAGTAPGAELVATADRIRRRVAALTVEAATPDGALTVGGISISVGGSPDPGDGEDLQSLLQAADTALYAAKRAGRNTVRINAVRSAGERSTDPSVITTIIGSTEGAAGAP